MQRLISTCTLVAVLAVTASTAFAQAPAAPKPWEGSVAAGLAVTGGNAQTTTTNLAFTVQSDKTKTNVFKADGLNIRSSRDGDAIIDRTLMTAEDNYTIGPRSYLLGRFVYMRDVFKSIDYLVSPTVGIGYKVVNTATSTLNADLAVGAVSEKNPGLERRTSGALTVGDKATHKLSDTATLTQSLNVLWNLDDFADSLLTFQAGIATNITDRTQLKIDFLDTFKNKPPSVLIKKNDTALVMSFVFKF